MNFGGPKFERSDFAVESEPPHAAQPIVLVTGFISEVVERALIQAPSGGGTISR